MNGDHKVIQKSARGPKFSKFTATQERLSQWLEYNDELLKDHIHGIILYKCTIEPSGDYKISLIKGIHPRLDASIQDFLVGMTEVGINWRFKKNKLQKVTYELVIPINCSINNYSAYNNHFYFYDSFFFMQHLQHHRLGPSTVQPPPSFR